MLITLHLDCRKSWALLTVHEAIAICRSKELRGVSQRVFSTASSVDRLAIDTRRKCKSSCYSAVAFSGTPCYTRSTRDCNSLVTHNTQ